MDCNKSDLPKGSSTKIVAVVKNLLNTQKKGDSALMKICDPDKKRVEELSAKEQECRRKFKEKLNKLKKMPMPPQPTINVTSEGLTEGELTIENVKRKFKQIFSKFFKESLPSATPELEKNIGKKQANDIKVGMGTKPIESAIYRFACVLPIKKNNSTEKDIESMICKSVGLLPETDQYVNNEQIVLISKDKQKTESASKPGNEELKTLPSKEKEIPSNTTTPTPESKVLKAETNLKAAPNTTVPAAAAPTNTKENPLNIIPDDKQKPDKKQKPIELVAKEKVGETAKIEMKEPAKKINSFRGGILSSILKNFAFDSKMFKPKSWFSGKSSNKTTKLKMIPFSSISKIPLKWRQGFVILGTIIPFYYTYHKIVTDNKLTI